MITRVNNKEVEVQCANYEICKTWINSKDLEVKTWDVCKNCDTYYNNRLCFIDNKKCDICSKIRRCASVPNCSNYVCVKHFKQFKN